jgi:hypothetical protein
MSTQFLTYDAIAISALLVALLAVGKRNAFDLSRCVGWYLLVFSATYILRPSLSELTGDFKLYQLLRIGNFEDHWQLMACAVPLALISFAVGYAAGAPRRNSTRVSRRQTEPVVNPHSVRVLIFTFLILGYISALAVLKFGSGAGKAEYGNVSLGVYEHNTAWFEQDDLFISSGTVLYYIATGNLGMSLLLAGPWLIIRVFNGWTRTNLIGHFFALLAVYFLKKRQVQRIGKERSHALVISAGVLVILMLFPLMGMLRGVKTELRTGSLFSRDAISMMTSKADPQDLLSAYVGTDSSISGFETTLDHLVTDPRSDLGAQYLYFYFFQPIPRIIWPGKGTAYTWAEKLRGVVFDPMLGLINGAPGAIGMAYEEWGWLGIPFEFILTGLIIRKWEEAARRRPRALHIQLGYAGLYSMLPQLARDSLFYMIPDFWLFKFGIPTFILWIMYRRVMERERLRNNAAPVIRRAGAVAAAGQG